MVKTTLSHMQTNKKDVLGFLNTLLRPKKTEKKKYGEVFTPLTLVDHMLDMLPKDVWTNPHLKWLDPCVGIGNFMVSIYYRLMEGLKKTIRDETARHNHILQKMLFMIELNPKNVHLCKIVFRGQSEREKEIELRSKNNMSDNSGISFINIIGGDALKVDTKEAWGIEKFDIVIGNPPYNDSSTNRGAGHTLWTKFLLRSFDVWLKPESGLLCFVTPSLWRQVKHPLLTKMKEKTLLRLSINDEEKGRKMFSCGTRFDVYLVKNATNIKKTKTLIDDQDGKKVRVYLNSWSFLPNGMYEEIAGLLPSDDEERCAIIHDRSAYGTDKPHVQIKKTKEFKFPVIYSIDKAGQLTLQWTNTQEYGHFGIEKLVFRRMGLNRTPFIAAHSDNGDKALTEWCFAFVAPKHEHRKMKDMLKTDKMSRIIRAIALRSEINVKVLKEFRAYFWEDVENI